MRYRQAQRLWRHGSHLGVTLACFLGLLLTASVQAASETYYPYILYGGKLQRFNDSTRVVYYKLDALENSQNWDYTKWSFIKDALVKQAFDDWSQALNGRLQFRETSDARQADIAVHWRNGFSDANQLGVERPNVISGGYLTDADIQITLTSRGRILPDETIKAIALHEIGHALGMNGHSPYPGDLMYPSIQPKVTRLSARDVRTIQQMYAQKPQITNPPGVRLAQFRQSLAEYRKGMAAYQRKDLATAYQHFLKAWQANPSDARLGVLAGTTAYQRKDYPHAIAHLEKFAAQQPEIRFSLADALMQQAKLDLQAKQPGRAVPSLQKARAQFEVLSQSKTTPTAMRQAAIQNRAWIDQQLQALTRR